MCSTDPSMCFGGGEDSMQVPRVLLVLAVILIAGQNRGIAEELISIDRLLSKEQQTRLGVPTMRPEQRETLRQALLGLFQQGYQIGRKEGLAARAPIGIPGGVIE